MAKDYRTYYDDEDTLQAKIRKTVIATIDNRVFAIAKEFKIIMWIDVDAKEGVITLRYAVGSVGDDRKLLSKFPIFEDNSKELLRLHAAHRLGLDMDDQIVAVTAPRVCGIVVEFVDNFTSFRKKEPPNETRNIQAERTEGS